MTTQNIELTKDPLTNIHIMAPLLDKEGCRDACAFMLGLMMGAGKNKEDTDNKNQPERKTG